MCFMPNVKRNTFRFFDAVHVQMQKERPVCQDLCS